MSQQLSFMSQQPPKGHRRVGILGGTFDPVHIGHLLAAEQSHQEFDLDQVIFMPAGRPPHKQKRSVLDAPDRLKMLLLATKEVPYFSVSDYELKKQGLSYTYETLTHLALEHPQTDLYFIMGADSVQELSGWVHPEIILRTAHILAAVRKDTSPDARASLREQIDHLMQTYDCKISLLDMPRIDISSSDLRQRAAAGASLRYLVPEPVREYILTHGLYLNSADV